MKKGFNWGVEWTRETDAQTGVEITKLCDYKSHSNHLYFTNPGWHDNNNRLVLCGDRNNRANLFDIDLRSGEITQLTDLDTRRTARDAELSVSCVSEKNNEAYFNHNDELRALSLETLEERVLWKRPPDGFVNIINPTADGQHIIACLCEDLSTRIRMDLTNGYVGMDEYFDAKPRCQLLRIPVNGGKPEVLVDENLWLSHPNASPTKPNLLTFCHEGPWHRVDNRIWAMDTDSGKIWPVRQRRDPGEVIGHEYWLADGERIGYHGTRGREAGGGSFLGSVRFDDTDAREYEFPGSSWHVHSNDDRLVVGDGQVGGDVLLWLRNANGYDTPRALCRHRCSMHVQNVHVHPRLSPDGGYVLYTSDKTGYASPYIARLPKELRAYSVST